jgi:hypothetical protein
MAAALGAAAGAHAQLVIFETEPNDSKAQATTTLGPAGGLRAYPMPGPTDSIAGVTLGDVPGGGANSPDYFDVVTGEDPDGLYCYYFEAEAAASPETSIRGLVQSFGTILQGFRLHRGERLPVRISVCALPDHSPRWRWWR